MLDSRVAVKVLADNWARNLDVRERFRTEAQLLRQADSDRILRVLDIGELPDGRPYFVTVLADRGSLADRLDRGELPLETALEILVEVAEAVCVLHRLGVVHRDIKPSNILFQTGGAQGERVLLADLGLAKELTRSSGLTQAAGSPGYMAPEQARVGAIVDERTDVYGLGALAHRLLTGATVDQPGGRRIPGPVERVVRRALRPDPDQRWPSCRAFADQLRLLTGRQWAPRRRRRLVAVTAMLLVVAALLSWPLARQETPGQAVRPAAIGPPSATPLAAATTAPTSAVDPKQCRPAELKVSMNAAGPEPQEHTRMGASLFFKSPRRCTLFGQLENPRFVRSDGQTLPRRFGDGVGLAKPVPVDTTAWGEAGMTWPKGPGGAAGREVTPARLEFRLPASLEVLSVPWTGGPVDTDGQVEINPIGPATG